ncbi:hypothetical protein Micbo1qcDRAFT_177214 [Microdochium bolleyi]|uniref:Uncharacterized protein n=1 Tax=Microdochium bolleyi TaxID=196109 RepID=A0A136IWR5_9PEZI|nr:hypothetical protein Micbo1qcDRAFT_177214 [Microdochium bolleyi]
MPSKTVLVTGCSPTGIGASMAREFQLRGHRVIATGLNAELLGPLADLGMETVVMDVTSEPSIAACVEEVRRLTRKPSSRGQVGSEDDDGGNNTGSTLPAEQRGPEHGSIDILINNAGLLHVLPFADAPSSDIRRVMDVNVVGVMNVTSAFLPLLVAGASAGTGDTIVANVCSINSDLRPPLCSLYNASKAALEVWGASIRPELAPLGVRVVSVKTGSIRTGLVGNAPSSELPPSSYYYAALKEFVGQRQMFQRATFMDPAVYARSVVGQLLAPESRWWPRKSVIWEGDLVLFAWIVRAVRVDFLWDWVFTKGSKLDQVQRPEFQATSLH